MKPSRSIPWELAILPLISCAAALLASCSGCNQTLVVIPNGTVLKVADDTPVTVATWDSASKTWIVRGKANINGYYADPPQATAQP